MRTTSYLCAPCTGKRRPTLSCRIAACLDAPGVIGRRVAGSVEGVVPRGRLWGQGGVSVFTQTDVYIHECGPFLQSCMKKINWICFLSASDANALIGYALCQSLTLMHLLDIHISDPVPSPCKNSTQVLIFRSWTGVEAVRLPKSKFLD